MGLVRRGMGVPGIALGVACVAVCALALGYWLHANKHKQSAIGPKHTIAAGALGFTYPASWSHMPQSELPKRAATSALGGNVVAGLCPDKQSAGSCAAGVDVTYVLFQQGDGFPEFPVMERALNRQLPQQFHKFRSVSVDKREARSGSTYLWYEFSFVESGQRQMQAIAAFSGPDNQDVLVVATGRAQSFQSHRRDLREMLDNATARV